VDYPDYIHPLALSVESGEAAMGIVICGSGNGAAITANKHQGIRAALCWNTELASLARAHNDANILSLPSRFISVAEAEAIVRVFLDTPFDGGRHVTRVNKIPA
jgi:ribose 5-phosphate isomerase B